MLIPWSMVALVLLCAILGVAIHRLHRQFFMVRVEGRSMEPNFRPGQRALARRVPPARMCTGRVVVMAQPLFDDAMLSIEGWKSGHWMIKRVAAVPGDRVPAELTAVVRSIGPVPTGRLLVLGDNPNATLDSRAFGYIPLDRVEGVVVCRFGQ